MKLPNYLRRLWRAWRNLDRLETAQASVQASREQLAVNRAMLAVTMRERDTAQSALQRIAGDLARMRAKQRRDLRESRLWVTRCRAVNVSEN